MRTRMGRTTIGNHLIRRLREIGIGEILGVPGDYNLQFIDQIQRTEGIEFVGCCNELNAAYAADGYARMKGAAALLTTYGVGDLSALCGIAGAAAEHVPLICITGAPPLHAMQGAMPLHHTLAEGDYGDVLSCFRPFTAAQIVVTPEDAAARIDRAILACLNAKKPVYLQLPSDVSHIEIEAPLASLPIEAEVQPAALRLAVDAALSLWDKAKHPAVLADMDAERFGYARSLLDFCTATTTPYAAFTSGKAVLPELHPLAHGLYFGSGSRPEARRLIEESDLLLFVRPRLTEVNSGHFTVSLPKTGAIRFCGSHVEVSGHPFYTVTPGQFLAEMTRLLAPTARRRGDVPAEPVRPAVKTAEPEQPLSHSQLWPRLAAFTRPGDVVVAEAGTSHIGLMPQPLPEDVTYINAGIWGAIGYTLPAVLGTALAAPDRRHLLFIGDGSFQLTVQELSTLLRLDLKPVIFLLNNRGYTIERYILGMRDAYNDIADWNYGALLPAFSARDNFILLGARTEGELEAALKQAESADRLVFVELHLDPYDAPEALKRFGPATARFDYGPQGPQNGPSQAPRA